MAKRSISKDCEKLTRVRNVVELQDITGVFNYALVYVETLQTIYEFVVTSTEIIDNLKVLKTPYGGDTRWIGIAGVNNFYGGSDGGIKPMTILLTSADFPLPNRTYQIPEAYGQTYAINITIDINVEIKLPPNINAQGNSVSIYRIYTTEDMYVHDYEDEWNVDILYNELIRTFIATSSTIAGERWIVREEFEVINNVTRTLSKLHIKNKPIYSGSLTNEPDLYVGGSEYRLISVSSVEGLWDYTNTYVFVNDTPYTMTLPEAKYNYGRVLRLYRDGTGLITIARTGQDNFGSQELQSLTLNDKQYIELLASANNRWIVTSQSKSNSEQIYSLSTGNLAPTSYVDTIICNNTTLSYITPDARLGSGKIFTIKKLGVGSVVINPILSQLIDGELIYTLNNINDTIVIQSDGTNWIIISKYVLSDLQNINLVDTTFTNQFGIINKGGVPFIHDFSYGNNGTVTTTGKNLFIGKNVGNFTMGSMATSPYESSNNIGIGENILTLVTEGNKNIGIGHNSLTSITNGERNIGVGFDTLTTSIGSDSIAIGNEALKLATGGNNIAIGSESLGVVAGLSSGYNVALGRHAFQNLLIGNDNLGLGYGAGTYIGIVGDEPLLKSSKSIFIGDSSRAKMNDSLNEIVVGAYAVGNGNNTTTIGNVNTVSTHLKGKVIADKSIQVGTDNTPPTVNNVGSIRYREESNHSYIEMCMKIGVGIYEWKTIYSVNW